MKQRGLTVLFVLFAALLFTSAASADVVCTEGGIQVNGTGNPGTVAWDNLTRLAVSTCPTPYTCTFAADGMTAAWSADNATGANTYFQLPARTTMTHFEWVLDITSTENFNSYSIYAYRLNPDTSLTLVATVHDGAFEFFGSTHLTGTYDTPTADVDVIQLALFGDGVGNMVVSDMALIGDCALTRPVRAIDVTAESEALPGNWVMTGEINMSVFAIHAGTIGQVYRNTLGYTVELTFDSYSVFYSSLETNYVKSGDVVSAGCVIGYAADAPPEFGDNLGMVGYAEDSGLPDWHDYPESLSNIPCTQAATNCLNANPDFDDSAAGWQSTNPPAMAVTDNADTVMLLPKGGQLFQEGFSVNVSDTYYITIIASPKAPATQSEVTVSIADTEAVLQVVGNGLTYQTLVTTGLSPAFTGIGALRISNSYPGLEPVKITFACLSTGDLVVAPPACYFADSDLQLESFTTTGGVIYHAPTFFEAGRYEIPDGGTLRAPVSISAFSDANTDFTLKLGGAAGTTGSPTLHANIVDTGTTTELEPIGNFTYATVFASEPSQTFTLTSGTNVNGELLINNTSGGGQTAFLYKVCLSSATGVWPGYDNADHTSGQLLPTDCTECHPPTDILDVPGWLAWLGCLFRYLLFCLIYTLINNVWSTIIAVGAGLGLLGLWLGKAISILAAWAFQAGKQLLIGLMSWAMPIINAVLGWLLTLPLFQSLLDTVSLVGIWVDGILSAIVGVVNIFLSGIAFIVVLFTLIGTAWQNFIIGFSAGSSLTFMLPDCYDTGSPLYDACLIFDIFNFAVAQLPALAALIAAAGFAMGWKRIKDAIRQLTEVLQS